MKRNITFLFFTFCLFIATLSAQEQEKRPHMSHEEFNNLLQDFITKEAELTQQEAANFFPIYKECQKEKFKLNERMWELRKAAHKKKEMTEEDYKSLFDETARIKAQIQELEKGFIERYHKAISYKKIFAVENAESRFYKGLFKKVRGRGLGREKEKEKEKR